MSKNGFAGLELLLVVGMLAILACIAVPRLDVCRSQRVDYEAGCLAADLRYLQEMSRNEKSCWQGIPDYDRQPEPPYLKIERHRYYIRMQERAHAVREHQAPSDVHFGMGSGTDSACIMFLPDGDIMSNARTIHVFLQNQHRAVIIDQAGRIRVEWRPADESERSGI